MGKTTEQLQEIVDSVQDRLSGTNKKLDLHESEIDKDARIAALEKEVETWHEKYVAMEATWRDLAKQSVNKDKDESKN